MCFSNECDAAADPHLEIREGEKVYEVVLPAV
jgi:hypothetical protein